jgi:shikimate dehydrogenase
MPFARLTGAILCAVVGKPIGHSKSPLIHRLFAEQFGLPLQYERLEVAPGALSLALDELRARGCRGVNVTVPLKAEAATLAQIRGDAVALAGAANTLWWTAEGELSADNTDGIGLAKDLSQNLGLALAGRSLLLLGAGGAAAGVIAPLLAAQPKALWVMNRDPERAAGLVERFRALGPIALAPRTESPAACDLIINATSAGLADQVPEFPSAMITPRTFCYDMFYGAGRLTPFVRRCRELGATGTSDGFGMLVEQAAEAFRIWHGRAPETASVLAALRTVFAQS